MRWKPHIRVSQLSLNLPPNGDRISVVASQTTRPEHVAKLLTHNQPNLGDKVISKDQSIVTQVAAKIASELTGITQTDGNLESIQDAYLSHFDFVRTALVDAHDFDSAPATIPAYEPKQAVKQANINNTVETFGASYESAGSGLTIKGTQHGPIPAWLVEACAKAGVTQVYDNRDTANDANRRPLFKAVDGPLNAKGQQMAFWPPSPRR